MLLGPDQVASMLGISRRAFDRAHEKLKNAGFPDPLIDPPGKCPHRKWSGIAVQSWLSGNRFHVEEPEVYALLAARAKALAHPKQNRTSRAADRPAAAARGATACDSRTGDASPQS